MFVQGLSASSRSAYAAGKRRYLLFCARTNLNPLPVTEATLCRFVAHLSTEGLRAQSISGYLSVVRHLSIKAGLPPLAREGCPRLAYILKGVSRTQAASGRPRRLPITPRILLSLKAVWKSGSLDSYSARLLWAMSLFAFFGCFRIGELTVQDASSPAAVEVADVFFEGSPVRARVHLRFSKTDLSGAGADVFLGFTRGPLCPVTALGNYLKV